MTRNLVALVVVNSLFGLAFGIYELALPLFLDDNGVSPSGIGLVLAAGAAVNFVLVVYGGRLADRVGRKGVYGGSFLALAAVNLATPLVPHIAYVTLMKTLHQACVSARGALRGILVYESVAVERFTHVFAQLVGLEVTCQVAGFLCVGFVGMGEGATLSYRQVFAMAAAALAVAAAVFWVLFREAGGGVPRERVRLTLRGVFTFDLHRKLYLIIAAGFIFGMGIALSHALWTLYFRMHLRGAWAGDLAAFDAWLREAWPGVAAVWTCGDRGAEFALISVIAFFHRLLLGVPMVLLAPLLRGQLKWLYVGGLVVEGLMIAAPGLVDWFGGGLVTVAVAWVIHDIFGASIWYPVQERFIQQFSRPERRATEVAKANALMALGVVAGQVLAGPLMAWDPALPFVVGGGMIALASLVLLPL